MNAQGMTSLEIAQVTGKMHKDVVKAIRNMEPAWVKVNGRNFALVDYKDSKGWASPLLLSHEDRVSLHRHEVQRWGPRQVGDSLAAVGAGAHDAAGRQDTVDYRPRCDVRVRRIRIRKQ